MAGANITLKEIIERKIAYAKEERDNAVPADFVANDPSDFTYEDYIIGHNGEIEAFEDMLADVEKMTEEEFTEKYRAIGKKLCEQIDEEEEDKYNRITSAKADGTDVGEVLKDFPYNARREWYNNAIWDILALFDMKNIFADK